MNFKHNLSVFSICCLLVASMIMATFFLSESKAEELEAETPTFIYEDLQPNVFMKNWLVFGAIPISDDETKPNDEARKKAFDADQLQEQGGESDIQPEPGLTQKINDKEYTWQVIRSEEDIVDFAKIYGKKEFAVAYAWAEIDMRESKSVLLGIGSDDAVKIWLNGELVHENWVGRAVNKDDDIVPVTFQKGSNTLLLKIQNGILEWGFCCQILGPDKLPERLFQAAKRGNLDDIEMLLSHGAEINATVPPGLTALHAAKISGKKEVVEFLLDKGADPNIEMPPKEEIVDSMFNSVIKDYSSGAAVLVAQDGEILYQKGFGYANLEHKVPVIPETKFRIGSITKQFTASAILKLQEEGKLNVDDKLSKFIPDYPRGDEVTIHHLLTHTSGIHSYTGKTDFMETVTVEVKPEKLIDSFKNDDFDFDPGEKWLYNNSGYFLLGYIVKKVSGESFDDYLKHNFFERFDMNNTGIHHWKLVLENEATGYSYENGKFYKALNWDMSRAGGAGALYSTVGDLYRWNEAVFNGKVLSESSLKAAFTPVTLNDGTKANAMGSRYGYGWMISEIRGLKEFSHGGGLNGWSAYLARFPEQNFSVVVLSNALPLPPGFSPQEFSRNIAEVYLWQEMADSGSVAVDKDIDTSIYDGYVGRYDYGSGAVLVLTREGDRLFAQLTGQPKFEIFPKSETEFFWKVVDAQIKFVKNENGEVIHVVHRQGGREFEAPKLKDETFADIDVSIYDDYVGEYDLKVNDMIIKVTKEDDRLFAQVTGQPKFEIFPKSETEFFWKVVKAQITFVKNEDGKVIKAILFQAGQKLEAPKIKMSR